MSKRRNENSTGSAPAAKKMVDGEQNEGSIPAPSDEKFYRYCQGHINVSPLYLATKLADVHFVFTSDDGTVARVPAHKALLVTASDVFDKMFCGEMKESGDVKIVDASAAAFKQFLQFFYLNDVKLTAKHVASVLYLGNKYNVENCVDVCVKLLTDVMTSENVCTALSLGVLYEQAELTELCEQQIMLHTADVFKSPEFLQCDKETLAHILQMNLFTCSEVAVFEACMDWARAKCKQPVLSEASVKKHLGDLIYRIRFASMTMEEFCNLKTKYAAVFSYSDFEAIVRIIGRMDSRSEQFNTLPRQIQWNNAHDAIIKCNRDEDESYARWIALEVEEKTTFSTSEPLLLGKFWYNGVYFNKDHPEDLESNLQVDVQIVEARTLDGANAKVVSSVTVNLNTYLTYLSLPHPILIRPNFFYTICAKKIPKGHCFNSFKQKSSMTLNTGGKIEFHNDVTIDGKIFGFIYELVFNKI